MLNLYPLLQKRTIQQITLDTLPSIKAMLIITTTLSLALREITQTGELQLHIKHSI